MSGYRQSSFDPNAHTQPGKPLRPFNWVQWTGVLFQVAGGALLLVDFAEVAGLLPPSFEVPSFATLALLIVGVTLVNSRREQAVPVTPEQQAANRRTLIITLVGSAAILGLVAAFQFLGD